MGKEQKSGANAPKGIGAKTVAHSSTAGANRVRGGCTPKGRTEGQGARPQRSGSKGG